MIKIEKAENCTIVDTMNVDKMEVEHMMVDRQFVRNLESEKDRNLENEKDRNTEEVCDEVIYENHVFVRKYASYEKLKQMRTQILACLATEDKEDVTNLVEVSRKNQLFLILGLLVSMKCIEDKRGFQTKFLQQMSSFFPVLFPDPKAYAKSLEREVAAWSKNGHILPYGEWMQAGKGMQDKKWRKFKAIAEHIKPILQEVL